MGSLPRRQRVGAYAVMLREREGRVELLLSRLSPRVSRTELWTLPGGGIDHGEDPRAAVIREIHEETGLEATVGETARVYSAHLPRASRDGLLVDAHAIRIVYDGWAAPDAPAPRVLEVDGSTSEAAWKPLDDVVSRAVPVTGLVTDALVDHLPFRLQRVAAYAVARRADEVLLTRLSARAAHPGRWTLPGGGVDHGEHPAVALAREVEEECGLPCEVTGLVGVHDTHFFGNAPSGRIEDYHGVHLIFGATVGDGAPRVLEVDGTTDAAAWVPVADIESGAVEVLDVVRHALRTVS
ncbi:ADP-ribose pyrophosphatase YjhB, NUDIX family [Nocardioides alpinus]|uniref:ADP-ribose pyrophosphatase YjhB, NUDIX family n=1 Tax=Nocardioides alpinus TaxID=748909 RepID=A0A1I0YV68_9ACTN|nr:NUDIX domain-containing protein [Nocardioides alpinus]PKH43740.1 NUDIX domain-containing protein [Nocardioides alpinus]SFB16716.1 ADP-ribose pyrophosphatase YjhB, NUDIX family [Nocardioides alpinus]